MGKGSGGTLGAHTFICEMWYNLLWVAIPAQGRFAHNTQVAC